MTPKVNPLTPNQLKREHHDLIIDRCDYIIRCIFDVAKINFAYWYFHEAEENEVGDFFESYNGDSVSFVSNMKEHFHISYNNKVYNLREEFPEEWLFQDIDFTQEISNCLEKYKENKNAKSLKNKETRAKNKQILEGIKKKLTKEELKVLGIK